MPLNKSWFILSNKVKKVSGFDDAHVRFAQALPEKFISAYTQRGDIVFDPFAGFGTTLFAAARLKRVGVGVEYDEKKFVYIKASLKPPHQIIHGSSLQLSLMKLPKIDLSFTSPPYMRYFDKQNPLSNYAKGGNYGNYLIGIDKIYSQMKKLVKKGGYVVIEIANTFDDDHPMTTLAWDVGKIVSKYFYLERDFIYCVKEGQLSSPAADDNHSYCLLFRNI